MNIAITGATGQLGRLVIEALAQRDADADVVALARTPSKAQGLGVTVRKADYDHPESLRRALTGVDTLLLISSSEVGRRARQHGHVIDAAKEAGVGRIVYTSVLRADTSALALAEEHRVTEAALATSAIPHTILRNGWYTENYLGAIGPARAHGALIGSAGEGRISSATRADFAEAAAAVLLSDAHVGKTYELAGDDAYTLDELAAEISRQTGDELPYRNLPETDYAAALEAAGLPGGLAELLASCDVAAADGALFDDGHQLSALIGRPTTPLSTAVAEALSSNA